MFEQDFICQTQLATSANLTLGRDWFRALDAAVLAAGGVDLQLCMMQPAHALASTTMRSVTNARATQDHVSPFSLSVTRARSFSFSFSLSVCARAYGLTYTWMYCAVPCCCVFLCVDGPFCCRRLAPRLVIDRPARAGALAITRQRLD